MSSGIPIALAIATSAHALDLSAFADVTVTGGPDLGVDEPAGPDPMFSRIALGMLDFYASQELSDRTDALIEVVFEGTNQGLGVEVERLQIGYALGQGLTLRVGRFHHVLGYWNTAYHHGAHLQPTIERPFFLRFEDDGGLVPVHLLGLWADMSVPIGSLTVDVDAMVGAGVEMLDEGGALEVFPGHSPDETPGGALRIVLRPTARPTVTVGLSSWAGVAVVAGDVPTRLVHMVNNAHATFDDGKLELIGEAYHWVTVDQRDVTSGSFGGYVQVGRTFRSVTPYVQVASVSLDTDPFFQALGAVATERVHHTIGVWGGRFDFGPRTSTKLEARAYFDAEGSIQSQGAVQCSAAF